MIDKNYFQIIYNMYTTIPLYKCNKCLIFLPHASLFKIIIKVTQNKSKNNYLVIIHVLFVTLKL